jgi:hypothetical protein
MASQYFQRKTERIFMKPRIFFSLVCGAMLFSTSPTKAEVAAGVILGEPTGLSVRINQFPVLGVAWSAAHNWMYVHGDYIFIDRTLEEQLRWYLGVGAVLHIGDGESGIGGRVPIGLLFPFDPKFELFGELVPGLNLVPEIRFNVGGGIGIRYIF